jgi:hypothetical protein
MEAIDIPSLTIEFLSRDAAGMNQDDLILSHGKERA